MLYQFLDWRMGRGRIICVLDVQDALDRVRAANDGILPLYLDTWESFVAFAGAAKIPLPDMEAVARGMVAPSQAYPTLKWLNENYSAFLLFVAEKEELKNLLIDPVPVQEVVKLNFNETLEKSVSNVDGGEPCSEPDPATSSPTSMFQGSPNSSLTTQRRFPKVLQQSTPIPVPRHLLERLKE